jgi:hypothetical protein
MRKNAATGVCGRMELRTAIPQSEKADQHER